MLICDVKPSGNTSKDVWIDSPTKPLPDFHFNNTPPTVERYWADALRPAYEQFGLDNSLAYVGVQALAHALINPEGVAPLYSHLFLYDRIRSIQGHGVDMRITPRRLMEELSSERTLPLNSDCNYGLTDGWFGDINQRFYKQCGNYGAPNVRRVQPHSVDIKAALVKGQPVMAMIFIGEEFLKLRGPWRTHNWREVNQYGNRDLGYYMVLINGYDDDSQRFLCDTNMDGSWGDLHGFGFKYDKVAGRDNEYWTLVPAPTIWDTPKSAAKIRLHGARAQWLSGQTDPLPKSYKVVAKRAISLSNTKKTNILNMFNKPAPKGLGLSVTIDNSTIVFDGTRGKVSIGKKGAVHKYQGRAGNSVNINFSDLAGTRHSLQLDFVGSFETQSVEAF